MVWVTHLSVADMAGGWKGDTDGVVEMLTAALSAKWLVAEGSGTN